jgi:HK97 family phage prohead protease
MDKTMHLTFASTIESSDTQRRIIAGVVLPFNKVGNTSAGPVIFESGSVQIPDAKRIKLLAQHNQTDPIGRAQNFQVTQDAIYGTFKISASSKGTDYLTLASEDLISSLSIGVDVLKAKANADGVLIVSSAVMKEVSLVESPAYADAVVTKVAASESEAESEATPTQPTTESEAILDTTPEATTTPAEVTPVEAARPTISASFYTEPRSPIKTQAQMLEHSIKAKLGNHESQQWVLKAEADVAKFLTAADDSFTTNPAFSPVQYVPTVVDTLIGARPAIDALGSKVLGQSGMVVSVPKITTSGTVAETAEGAAPSETGIISSYVNLTVKKYSGLQRYSLEILERSDPSFFAAMLDNMTRAYNKATDSAVIAALTAGGTQGTAVAASSAGIISYVSTEAPAAYLATGELATKYIAGTSQWSLLLGATDTTGRPIYSAANPMNNAGQSAPASLRGNVLGLDLYVDPNAVSTTIDESAFIVVPSSVSIYESPILRFSTNIPTSGEIETSLYGYMAVGVLVAGGVRRFNLT